MPEDSKKNLDKKKNDPKEQRKPRNPRNQAGRGDRKPEGSEESKSGPKVSVQQKPPVYVDPGPEFYQNLKRETEEIIKITEEENSKYKKKEIQSNWSKYEMPIESYEEIEEQDLGADYEKLIQAPLSIGGHFQFKHEKSWDANTGPSLYDKYFEINMDNLSLAVSTIPFYERNGIEQTLFSESDMLSMNNRATKYKQKYFNDKSYSTSETEAQDKILNSLKEGLSKKVNDDKFDLVADQDITDNELATKDDIDLDFKEISESVPSLPNNNIKENVESICQAVKSKKESEEKLINLTDQLRLEDMSEIESIEQVKTEKIITSIKEKVVPESKVIESSEAMNIATSEDVEIKSETTVPVEAKKLVIESPEDLEKWLDDFLDG